MNIKLNTTSSDITVYDKDNLKHATGNEIVHLKGSIHDDFKRSLIDIISSSVGLIESEKEMYIAFLKDIPTKASININEVIKLASIVYDRSTITYRRAVDKLIVRGIIKYVDSYKTAVVNPQYDINSISNTAKYIVIEVQPRVVSPHPTL